MASNRTALVALVAALAAAGCTTLAPEPQPAESARPARGLGISAEGFYRLGRYMQGQGKLDDALAAYDEALRLDPAHADALNASGSVHSLRGRADLAEDSFRRALAVAPQSPRTLNNLGYHLAVAGRAQEALPLLEQAARLAPSDRHVQANLQFARSQLRRVEAAPEPAQPRTEVAAAPQATLALRPVQEGIWELRNGDAPGAAAPMAAATPAAIAPAAAPASPVVAATVAAVQAAPAPTATAPAAPAAATRPLRLEVANGNGRAGLARSVAASLHQPARLTNNKPFGVAVSRIEYVQGAEGAALSVREQLPVPLPLAQVAALGGTTVRVLLGKDFPRDGGAQRVAAAPTVFQP